MRRIECIDARLYPRLGLLSSTAALIYAAMLVSLGSFSGWIQDIIVLTLVGSLIALSATICLAPGSETTACMLAFIYPLAGVAAYIKARKSGTDTPICKSLAATSVIISILVPLAVYYCLRGLEPHQPISAARGRV